MKINLNTNQIIDLIKATPQNLKEDFIVKNIASLETAGPEDIAILLERGDASVFDALSPEKIGKCSAGVFLAQKPVVDGKTYLLVDDVLAAFTLLVDKASQQKTTDDYNTTAQQALVSKKAAVAPTAILGPGVIVCAGATISEHSIVQAHSYIGHNCKIGSHVLIHPGVKILDECSVGNGTIVHAGTVIGSDGFGYMVTRQGLRKIPQIGTVVIGDMVEIGANCTIDRASFDQTKIGNGVKIDNGVHIAHNVIIGDATAILAQTGIAGSTKIGIGCQIGGQVAIKNDLIIGNGVKIVSKSGVMHNLNDGETVCGFPATSFMQWKRQTALINKLPEWSKLVASLKQMAEPHKLSFWQKIKKIITK